MRSRLSLETPFPPFRARCRCGHLPTHHMVVVPVGTSGNYRLEPAGLCALCGEGTCRKYGTGEPERAREAQP
jgi:hypothetical protein